MPISAQAAPPGPNGEPAQIDPAGFKIRMPLGATPDSEGFNTGSLTLSGPISTGLVDVSKLELRDPNGNGLQVISDAGNLRQVTNLTRLADIQSVSGGGFEVRYYDEGTFGTVPSGGLYPINGGSDPYLTVAFTPVEAVASQHQGGVRVTTTGRDGVARQKEILATSSDGTSRREITGNGAEVRDYTSVFDYDTVSSQWRRIDSAEVTRDGVLVSKTQRTYLYQVRTEGDPAQVVENHLFLAEELVYDTANSWMTTSWEPDPNHLGRAKSVTYPDGSWEAYRYYDDVGTGEDSSWRGKLRETLRPWNGQPADPSQATSSNSESSLVTYQFSEAGIVPVRHTTTRPYDGGVVTVSDRTSSSGKGCPYSYLLEMAGLSPEWVPLYDDVYYDGQSELASENESMSSGTSYTYVGSHVAGSPWVGRSMGSVDGEGDGRITGYERGNYDIGTGAFTANDPADNSNWGTFVRSITVNIENGWLPTNSRATKEIEIEDERGKTLRKELWIMDAAEAWNLASTTTFEYPAFWDDGAPKEIIKKRDGRVVSHRVALSGNETVVWDEQGVETSTVRDDSGRTVSVTRVGAGSQPDLVTTFAYSGLTTTTVTAAGGVSRTQVTVEDLAGRTVSETNPSGAVTGTSYPNGGRDTLTTLPGNLTRLATRNIDGRTVSVTGPAVVDEHYEYEVLPSGNLATTRRTGDLVDSPRYSITEEDWAGRTVKVTTPSPLGSGEVTSESFYVFGSNTLEHTTSPAGTMVHYKDDYDGMEYSGLDTDEDLGLTLWGTDRMTSTLTNHAFENGYWWEVSTRRTYDTNDDADSFIESVSKRCLHGNPNGLASWTISSSSTNGTVTMQTTIDRASKTLTQTEITSAATTNAVSVSVNGLLASQKGHDAANPTRWDYDGFGQPIREVSPRGAVTRKSYFADGSLETITDHAGKVTSYLYYAANHPSAGKLQTITNPEQKTTTRTYSPLGQMTEEAGTAAYKVTCEYDAYGARKKMWTWRDATTSDLTEWVYQDGTGLLLSKKDAADKATSYTYYDTGKIHTRTWARTPAVTTTYSYSTLGDLNGINYSDATPDVTLTGHDRLERPTSITQTGIGSETLTYHPGKAAPNARYYTATHTLLPGRGIRNSLPDAAGRPSGFVETSGSNVTAVRTLTYAYEPASGNLSTITDGTQSHIYAYHPNSSLVSTINSRTSGTSWFRETHHYDTPGRLIGIRSDRMAGTALTAEISSHGYDYDSLNRRTKNTFQDGSYWQYGYNDRSEVTSATRKTATGTEVTPLAAAYSYDGIGNRLTSTSPVLGDHVYTPDSRNRYATITTGNSRSAVGRAPTTWNIQVAGVAATRIGELYHRTLTASNSTAPVWQSVITRRDTGTPTTTRNFWYAAQTFSPTYDDDGNLTNDGRWLYSWDAENRLIQMETTTQATTATHPYTKLKFVYDWQGRRIARHVWKGGTQASPTFLSSRRWLYDGWNVVAEFSATSATTPTVTRLNTFTWGLDLSGSLQGAGGVGGLLVQTTVSGGVMERASYDGNGNIVAWTKSTASAPTSRREYDAFGNTLVSEGTTPSTFGFSTKMQDAETGLYYYGYRFYDPVMGRWPSRDPIGESGGINLYGFVGNNGIGKRDLLGKKLVSYEKNSAVIDYMPDADFDTKYNSEPSDPNRPWVNKKAGVTDPDWPKEIAKCDGCKLKLDGELKVGIVVRKSNKGGVGADGMIIEDHERLHEGYSADQWNDLVGKLNSYDKFVFKSKTCCGEWAIYINQYAIVAEWADAVTNAQFDVSAYGGDPKGLADARKEYEKQLSILNSVKNELEEICK